MSEEVYDLFRQSVEAKMQVGEALAPFIEQASDKLVQTLLEDHKILICGNGSSHALAQILASCLIGFYEKERPSLPAIHLHDQSLEGTSDFSKVLRVLGQTDDVLIVISSDSNTSNLIDVIHTAHDKNIHVIAINHQQSSLSALLTVNDINLSVDIDSHRRIDEIHLLVLHSLCHLIDRKLFGIE